MKNNLSAELAINIDLVGADSEKFKLSTPISKAIEQIKSKVSEVNEKITEAEKVLIFFYMNLIAWFS